MVKIVRTRSEFYNYLNEIDKDAFYIDLCQQVDYLNFRFLMYKGKIADHLLNSFDDDKYGIVHVMDTAREALDLSHHHIFDHRYDTTDNDRLICSKYEEYLHLLTMYGNYFARIYNLGNMFSSNLYKLGDFPEVPGTITGAYYGKNNGYDKQEVVAKFVNSIIEINREFELAASNPYDSEGVLKDE